MSIVYNCSFPEQRDEGFIAAQAVLKNGQCIVMPTDTMYGIAADAFSKAGVSVLLAAKGRDRRKPPPVLIADSALMDVLACDVSDAARALAEAFWPGPLTLIFKAQPSLQWDLGDTLGTVALRVPDDACALRLLKITGPLAVSSANRTGNQAASTINLAREQLQEAVSIYLDAGPRPVGAPFAAPTASTIIDATGGSLKIVRQGLVAVERLQNIAPRLEFPREHEA